jgi:oxygen-dependent protoporphyrinogen oxidase
MHSQKRVAIIGGGISGLSAALRLHQTGSIVPYVFEAADRLGGVLQTERQGDFLVEQSADMFTTKEVDALVLCQKLGIDQDLISTQPDHRRAFILSRGKLLPVPTGFVLMSPQQLSSIRKTRLLSLRGKIRAFCEQWIKRRKDVSDESLASFATRRFGREAYERLIQPLIGGIYTADPQRLSMLATMQEFVEQERDHGSLIVAAQKQFRENSSKPDSGARYGKFLAPRQGMSEIVRAIGAQLNETSIRLNTVVSGIQQTSDSQWRVTSNNQSETFDDLIIATPAPAAAELLRKQFEQLATALNKIEYASVAIVIHGFKTCDIRHPLDGFGFVVPQVERRKILACSFASRKFAGRAADDQVLMRTFVGGALQPELLEHSDDQIAEIVADELNSILGIEGSPLFCQVRRWWKSMPQYHVGHLDLVADIEHMAHGLEHFALAGNAYHGVGVPACVRSGRLAACRIIDSHQGIILQSS